MAIIKCKMCGGDMELSPDKTFGTCEYCGSVMTLPRVDDDQRAAQFNRGNHFRRQGEFDKALAVYERIVAENDADAEAHWCCALCRFGIEYVEDPATYEYIPTCHRASFDSFLEDVDYLAALEHSDGITRRQYQKDGAKIAEVQRGILATSRNEEPYDVFICYKETDDETKERTRDSLDAQEIYYNLTQEGYRVFFSRITLEDKAGTEYEPYIFAALNSAKVMVVVGEKAEYFNAVWVKNEWSRFLSLMRKDRAKLLLPCYKNVDPYDLPEQLGVLQSYDMGKIGFMQDLIRGIKKVLQKDEPKEAAQPVVQQVIQQSPGGANLTAQLKRGMQALEDKDWTAADGFFDKALDMDAECAEAFFGKALAAARCANGEELVQKRLQIGADPSGEQAITACEREEVRINAAVEKYRLPGYLEAAEVRALFSYDKRTYPSMVKAWQERIAAETAYWKEDRNLGRAMRYAKGDTARNYAALREKVMTALKTKLTESESADKTAAAETVRRCREALAKAEEQAGSRRQSAEERREQDYRALCDRQAKADTDHGYWLLAADFGAEKLRAYKDCADRAEQCLAEAERIRAAAEKAAAEAKKKKKTVRIVAAALAVAAVAAVLIVTQVVIPGNKYKAAEAQLSAGEYDEAIAAFRELGSYKDSTDRSLEAGYAKAEVLLGAGEYDEAIAAFRELGSYKDSADRILEAEYAKAEVLLTAGNERGAALAFSALGGYKDAADRVGALWDKIAVRKNTIAVGDWHTVGLRTDGAVVAVGRNLNDQCNVSTWKDIVAVAAGGSHTVGLRADGTVVAVGRNDEGQCSVGNWKDIVSIAAGGNHTVGLCADGTVVAVGRNDEGQCSVGDWRDIAAIAAGGNHTVGLRADGTVVAVGSNLSGQCNVKGWNDIVAVAAGGWHTVGLRSNGTVVAVGRNDEGQCSVGYWRDIVAIAAGGYHTVGLRANGTVVAAGNNDYCDVSGWRDFAAIAAGSYHTVGLRADGTVVAVGSNGYGQCDVSDWTDIRQPNQ